MNSPTIYVSDVALARRFGVHRTTVWRWVQTGLLARPVQLSPGCTRWRMSDVEQFETERAQAGAQ